MAVETYIVKHRAESEMEVRHGWEDLSSLELSNTPLSPRSNVGTKLDVGSAWFFLHVMGCMYWY